MLVTSKRKKMDLLLSYGLRDNSEFKKSVQIFSIKDTCGIESYCMSILSSGLSLILIAVPIEYERKLPNFHIADETALNTFFAEQHAIIADKYSEIWCCPQSYTGLRSFGRISIKVDDLWQPIILEMVYGKSARDIDHFSGVGDFISVVFDFKNSDITVRKESHKFLPKGQLLSQALVAQRDLLLTKMEAIISFALELRKIHINELCLEFVYQNEDLVIIDFDTENDKRVINEL